MDPDWKKRIGKKGDPNSKRSTFIAKFARYNIRQNIFKSKNTRGKKY